MEVVCLIFGPMLALFACFSGFDIPTSFFIFVENVFLFLFLSFFFLNDVNILFVDCRNTRVSYNIMKSYNHIFIKICSSMKVSLVYINYLYILCLLQMMSILYFTYSTVCSPSVYHCVNHSVFQCLS